MLHDQHMHSSYSRDSEELLRNYFIEAKRLGIKYLLTCEHYDFETTVDGTTWDVDYDALLEEHQKLKKEFPTVTPLLGLELGYRKDYFEEMVEISNKYDYDLIQLSIHDYFYNPRSYPWRKGRKRRWRGPAHSGGPRSGPCEER